MSSSTFQSHAEFLDALSFWERIHKPYSFRHALLVLYAPFGICLLLVRVTLGFLAAAILPRFFNAQELDQWSFHTYFAWLTGTFVIVENQDELEDLPKHSILVSNHISEFDAIAIRSIVPCYVMGYDFYEDMLWFKLWNNAFDLIFVPYVQRGEGGTAARDKVRQIVVDKLKDGDKPVLCFPEAGLTNGTYGLMQYYKFNFSLDCTVQPFAIQVSNAPFPVNIHNDSSFSFIRNAAWYLFLPWHIYRIRCLPRTRRSNPDETEVEFAQRVREDTARALKIQATPYFYKEKYAYVRYKTKQDKTFQAPTQISRRT